MMKIFKKFFKKNTESLSSRITSETVAEHREKILAGGRRFKYPIQYARHKLVINAIIVSFSALIVAFIIGWYSLYIAQNTSNFIYSVTKALPIPIANVDGQPVLYKNYLMEYLSQVRYLEVKEQLNSKSKDGQRQLDYIKRQSLDGAIADAYALKLSKKLNISISDEDIEGFLIEQRKSIGGGLTEKAYNASIMEYFGWNPDEYRDILKNRLLRQKVSYSIDEDALSLIQSIYSEIKDDSSKDFKTLVESSVPINEAEAVFGDSGWIPKTNQNGGLAQIAGELNKGQISSVIKSTNGEGYFIIKLKDSNSTQVSYEYIKVALTKFDSSLQAIKDQSKVDEYIKIN